MTGDVRRALRVLSSASLLREYRGRPKLARALLDDVFLLTIGASLPLRSAVLAARDHYTPEAAEDVARRLARFATNVARAEGARLSIAEEPRSTTAAALRCEDDAESAFWSVYPEEV